VAKMNVYVSPRLNFASRGMTSRRARPSDLSEVVTEMPIKPRTVGSPRHTLGKRPILPVQLITFTVEREAFGKSILEFWGDNAGLGILRPRVVLDGQTSGRFFYDAERRSDLRRTSSRQDILHLWNGDTSENADHEHHGNDLNERRSITLGSDGHRAGLSGGTQWNVITSSTLAPLPTNRVSGSTDE
jgi:hypothetical protein